MLFDFIAFISTDTNQETPISYDNPFTNLPPYSSLTYHTQCSSSEYAQAIVLHKHANESSAVYQDEKLEVYIYGYCFPRLSASLFSEFVRIDAQQIAGLYYERGLDFIEMIKGSFSLLILDKAQRETHILTDPFNVRPVYYHQAERQLIVSTSLSALLRHRQRQNHLVSINYPAIIEYYLFEYILNEDTYIDSVYSVPPGSHLHYAQEIKISQYWNVLDRFSNFSIHYSEPESIDQLETILKRNLGLYLTDPDRTAVALTGGYDSRTNLALLGDRVHDFFFYSYGVAETYDLSIPRRIAKKLNLNYRAILLDETYQRTFAENATLAIALGDGIAEANRANYLFAFRQLSSNYDYILTGLFGSELVKHPTSVGNFINEHAVKLLSTHQQEQYLDTLLTKTAREGYLNREIWRTYSDTVKQRVLTNPFINNQLPFTVKYFYYLLMLGVRKYFTKEIKVERPLVENLHPFLDIEFVETLLKTPFPWVHHWTGGKDLRRSLRTHRFYVSLIQRNCPQLASILSTHAYTPRYLMNPLTLPLIALQYPYYRRRIQATSSFRSQEPIWRYFEQNPVPEDGSLFCLPTSFSEATDAKNVIKLASLQQWFHTFVTSKPYSVT